MNIERIVIHCSATKPSQDIGAAEIDQWHRDKGWSRIGYNYVIRRDGSLEIGREEGAELAHAAGFNKNSIAICMVGGISEHNVAEANFQSGQWITLRRLVDFFKLKYPTAEIMGHRDLPGVIKDCPSFDVKTWVRTATIIDPKKRQQ